MGCDMWWFVLGFEDTRLAPWLAPSSMTGLGLKLKQVHRTPLGLPSNVSGTPTLGLYQPRALCAVRLPHPSYQD
eukprot:scaffold17757_cov62-Phaeocystis_antarctica.AAC.5